MDGELLDPGLRVVGQLESISGEELDPVVLKRVVRGGDDHSRICPKASREERDAWSGHGTSKEDVHTHRADARRHGRLQQISREARVLSDDYLVAFGGILHLADVRNGTPESQGHFGSHGLRVREPPHAACSEQAATCRTARRFPRGFLLFAHRFVLPTQILLIGPVRSLTSSTLRSLWYLQPECGW